MRNAMDPMDPNDEPVMTDILTDEALQWKTFTDIHEERLTLDLREIESFKSVTHIYAGQRAETTVVRMRSGAEHQLPMKHSEFKAFMESCWSTE